MKKKTTKTLATLALTAFIATATTGVFAPQVQAADDVDSSVDALQQALLTEDTVDTTDSTSDEGDINDLLSLETEDTTSEDVDAMLEDLLDSNSDTTIGEGEELSGEKVFEKIIINEAGEFVQVLEEDNIVFVGNTEGEVLADELFEKLKIEGVEKESKDWLKYFNIAYSNISLGETLTVFPGDTIPAGSEVVLTQTTEANSAEGLMKDNELTLKPNTNFVLSHYGVAAETNFENTVDKIGDYIYEVAATETVEPVVVETAVLEDKETGIVSNVLLLIMGLLTLVGVKRKLQ